MYSIQIQIEAHFRIRIQILCNWILNTSNPPRVINVCVWPLEWVRPDILAPYCLRMGLACNWKVGTIAPLPPS